MGRVADHVPSRVMDIIERSMLAKPSRRVSEMVLAYEAAVRSKTGLMK